MAILLSLKSLKYWHYYHHSFHQEHLGLLLLKFSKISSFQVHLFNLVSQSSSYSKVITHTDIFLIICCKVLRFFEFTPAPGAIFFFYLILWNFALQTFENLYSSIIKILCSTQIIFFLHFCKRTFVYWFEDCLHHLKFH